MPPLTPLTKPNVVVLMLDDHPAMDSRVFERLSNINSLFIEQGISFTNYWGNFSLCCPGRANVLTGQEAHHHGVTKNRATLFDPRMTIATELQDAGYHTLISGKYFNRTSRLLDKTPIGWNDIAIKDEGAYFDYPAWINGRKELHGHEVADYSADVMADYSLEFLRDLPADQPVFALLTPNATHGGWDETGTKVDIQPVAAPRHRGDARCTGIPPWKPASYNEANVADKPSYIRSKPLLRNTNGWSLQKACESLLSVDEWVGRVVEELRVQGRYENTVFILIADNGMGWGAHRVTGKVAPYTAQMPLFISWPAVIGNVVSENTELLSNVDIAPTLCELGGCTMGPFPNGFGVDGHSFAGFIASSMYSSTPDRDAIILEGVDKTVPLYRGIMTSADHPLGQWLFVRYVQTGETELYNMSGGSCPDWQLGESGDPCMLRNKANKPSFSSIRIGLQEELDSSW